MYTHTNTHAHICIYVHLNTKIYTYIIKKLAKEYIVLLNAISRMILSKEGNNILTK